MPGIAPWYRGETTGKIKVYLLDSVRLGQKVFF